MKNIFKLLIIYTFLISCSFDNKSGIWKNNDDIKIKENPFKDFKKLYTEDQKFNKIIKPSNNFKIKLDPIKKPLTWQDEYYQNSNNSENYFYKNKNEVLSKGKKISSKNLSKKLLIDQRNLITYDKSGNIFVFSIDQNQIIFKFNFYKKNFKKIDKKLNLSLKDGKIYISDNLGYLYALDYLKEEILWAKNFKVPFRSNIKLFEDKIFLADQDNTFYVVNRLNGDRIRNIPTEEVTLKNEFINSIALNSDSIFFLNTYGSLYSVNMSNSMINWFVNLNKSTDINIGNSFSSQPVVLYKQNLIISSQSHLYILNSKNGSTILKKSIDSSVKPVVSGDHLFFITKNSLLICLNSKNSQIEYSVNINNSIAKFLNTKEKSVSIKNLKIVNDKLYLFLNNSFIVKFDISGKIENIEKLKFKIQSDPIFLNGAILYLSNKNQLIEIN